MLRVEVGQMEADRSGMGGGIGAGGRSNGSGGNANSGRRGRQDMTIPSIVQHKRGTVLLTLFVPRALGEQRTGDDLAQSSDGGSSTSTTPAIKKISVKECTLLVPDAVASNHGSTSSDVGSRKAPTPTSSPTEGSSAAFRAPLGRMVSAPAPPLATAGPAAASGFDRLHRIESDTHAPPGPLSRQFSMQQRFKPTGAAAADAARQPGQPGQYGQPGQHTVHGLVPAFQLADTPQLAHREDHLYVCELQTPRLSPKAWRWIGSPSGSPAKDKQQQQQQQQTKKKQSGEASSQDGDNGLRKRCADAARFELQIKLSISFAAKGHQGSTQAGLVEEVKTLYLSIDQSNATNCVKFAIVHMPTAKQPPASPITLCAEYMAYVAASRPGLDSGAVKRGPMLAQAAWLVWHQALLLSTLRGWKFMDRSYQSLRVTFDALDKYGMDSLEAFVARACLTGQILRFAQHHRSLIQFSPRVWELAPLITRQAAADAISTWLNQRRSLTAWEHGLEMLLFVFKQALRGLICVDMTSILTSFRYPRVFPVLTRVRAMPARPALVWGTPYKAFAFGNGLALALAALREVKPAALHIPGTKQPPATRKWQTQVRQPFHLSVCHWLLTVLDQHMGALEAALAAASRSKRVLHHRLRSAIADGVLQPSDEQMLTDVHTRVNAGECLVQDLGATLAALRKWEKTALDERGKSFKDTTLRTLIYTFNFGLADEDKAIMNALMDLMPASAKKGGSAAGKGTAGPSSWARGGDENDDDDDDDDDGDDDGEDELEDNDDDDEVDDVDDDDDDDDDDSGGAGRGRQKRKGKKKAKQKNAPLELGPRDFRVTTISGTGTRGNQDTPIEVVVDTHRGKGKGKGKGKKDTGPASASTGLSPAASATDGGTRRPEREQDTAKEKKRKKKPKDERPSFNSPQDVLSLPNGDIVVCDRDNARVRVITPEGKVSTALGVGKRGHQDGVGAGVRLAGPRGMTQLASGSFVVTDAENHCIREVSSALAKVETIAGCTRAGVRDGDAAAAEFRYPTHALEIPRQKLILITDTGNHTIRAISPPDAKGHRTVRTVAGRAGRPGHTDGPSGTTMLDTPAYMALLPNRNVVFTDEGNHCVRVLDTKSWRVETLFGTPMRPGKRVGVGVHALLRAPSGIVVSPGGDIFVSDTGNDRVVMYSPVTQEVIVVAGGFAEREDMVDGHGRAATLQGPRGLTFDNGGCLIVAEGAGHRVRRIATPAATDRARLHLDTLMRPIARTYAKLSDAVKRTYNTANNTVRALNAAATCINETRQKLLPKMYAREAAHAMANLHMFKQSPDLLPQLDALIGAVPVLHSLQDVITPQVLEDPMLRSLASDKLLEVLGEYSWSPHAYTRDMQQLIRLAEAHFLTTLHGQTVFGSKAFRSRPRIDVDGPSLTLLTLLLQQNNGKGFSDPTFRAAAFGWITRVQEERSGAAAASAKAKEMNEQQKQRHQKQQQQAATTGKGAAAAATAAGATLGGPTDSSGVDNIASHSRRLVRALKWWSAYSMPRDPLQVKTLQWLMAGHLQGLTAGRLLLPSLATLPVIFKEVQLAPGHASVLVNALTAGITQADVAEAVWDEIAPFIASCGSSAGLLRNALARHVMRQLIIAVMQAVFGSNVAQRDTQRPLLRGYAFRAAARLLAWNAGDAKVRFMASDPKVVVSGKQQQGPTRGGGDGGQQEGEASTVQKQQKGTKKGTKKDKAQHDASVPQSTAAEEMKAVSSELHEIVRRITATVGAQYRSLVTTTCSLSALSAMHQHSATFRDMCYSINIRHGMPALTTCVRLRDSALAVLNNAREVALDLMVGTEVASAVTHVSDCVDTLQLAELCRFVQLTLVHPKAMQAFAGEWAVEAKPYLTLNDGQTIAELDPPLPSLPKRLLTAAEWLQSVRGAELFRHIWQDCTQDVVGIWEVAAAWRGFWTQLQDGTLSLDKLYQLSPVLKKESLILLAQTAHFKPDHDVAAAVTDTTTSSSSSSSERASTSQPSPATVQGAGVTVVTAAATSATEQQEDAEADGGTSSSIVSDTLALRIRAAADKSDDFFLLVGDRLEAEKWVSEHGGSLGQTTRLVDLVRHADHVTAVLPLMEQLLLGSARPALRSVRNAVDHVQRSLPQDWRQQPISTVAFILPTSSRVDRRYMAVSQDVLRQLKQHGDLLHWLRSFHNDQEFKASIEMAMGKTENECPFELWVNGRVDEEVLSMLGAVRRHFYPFLYRQHDQLSHPRALLEPLVALRTPPANLDSTLTRLSGLLDPLVSLVDAVGDAGTTQLLQLMQPKTQAAWVVVQAPGQQQSNVFLQFFLPRRQKTDTQTKKQKNKKKKNTMTTQKTKHDGSHESESETAATKQAQDPAHSKPAATTGTAAPASTAAPKKQDVGRAYYQRSLEELEDFHARLLLKTENRSAQAQAAVAHFVEQFAWVKKLSSTAAQLHEAGHLHYSSYLFHFPLAHDPQQIVEAARHCSRQLSAWEEGVRTLREQYYVLNVYTPQTAWSLLHLMHRAESTAAGEPSETKGMHDKQGTTTSDTTASTANTTSTAAAAAATTAQAGSAAAKQDLQRLVSAMLMLWNADLGCDDFTVACLYDALLCLYRRHERRLRRSLVAVPIQKTDSGYVQLKQSLSAPKRGVASSDANGAETMWFSHVSFHTQSAELQPGQRGTGTAAGRLGSASALRTMAQMLTTCLGGYEPRYRDLHDEVAAMTTDAGTPLVLGGATTRGSDTAAAAAAGTGTAAGEDLDDDDEGDGDDDGDGEGGTVAARDERARTPIAHLPSRTATGSAEASRQHASDADDLEQAAPAAHVQTYGDGVNLVCVESHEEAIDTVLSAYALHRQMPEHATMLLSRPHTSVQEVVRFVARWGQTGSHKKVATAAPTEAARQQRMPRTWSDAGNGVGDDEDELLLDAGADGYDGMCEGAVRAEGSEKRLFCIMLLDVPLALQQTAAEQIQLWSRYAQAPLLVVAGADSTHYVSNQLAFARCSAVRLPLDTTQQIVRQYLQAMTAGVTVVASEQAGAGKTFWVRQDAAAHGYALAHVPITSFEQLYSQTVNAVRAMPSSVVLDPELLNATPVTRNTSGGGGGGVRPHTQQQTAIHFDVCLLEEQLVELDALMFGLVLLELMQHRSTVAFWKSATTRIYIEVPSLYVLRACRTLRVLGLHIVRPSAATFCTDATRLRIGMRHHFQAFTHSSSSSSSSASATALALVDTQPVRNDAGKDGADEDGKGDSPGTEAGGDTTHKVDSVDEHQATSNATAAKVVRTAVPDKFAHVTAQQRLSFVSRVLFDYYARACASLGMDNATPPYVSLLCEDESKDLPAEWCWSLLELAMVEAKEEQPSLWSVWNTINVLFYQLAQLLLEGRVLLGCNPSTRPALAARIIGFVLDSALQFGGRQTVQAQGRAFSDVVQVRNTGVNLHGAFSQSVRINGLRSYVHPSGVQFYYCRHREAWVVEEPSQHYAKMHLVSTDPSGTRDWCRVTTSTVSDVTVTAAVDGHAVSSLSSLTQWIGKEAPGNTVRVCVAAGRLKKEFVATREQWLCTPSAFIVLLHAHDDVVLRLNPLTGWCFIHSGQTHLITSMGRLGSSTWTVLHADEATKHTYRPSVSMEVDMPPPDPVPAWVARNSVWPRVDKMRAERQVDDDASLASPTPSSSSPSSSSAPSSASAASRRGASTVPKHLARTSAMIGTGDGGGGGDAALRVGHRKEEHEEEDVEKVIEDAPNPFATAAGRLIQPWGEALHDCLVFHAELEKGAFLLSLQPYTMRNFRLGLATSQALEEHGVVVPQSFTDLEKHVHEVLSGMTGHARSSDEARALLGGKYHLTIDNLLKMVAVYVRLRCGIPVVLLGECGCGKTMLIRFLCEWLDVPLLILDVHGGTQEREFEDIFARAEKELASAPNPSTARVFVFLDEVNTCNHIGLVREIVFSRSLHGRPISSGIKVLCALNPYRERVQKEGTQTPGLVYTLQQERTDTMAKLVYRVHPVPLTFLDFAFDFGQLSSTEEDSYILGMVQGSLPDHERHEHELVARLILLSQAFIRECDGDVSAASLRDVRRCLNLLVWFKSNLVTKKATKISPLAVAATLALAFTYWYRLNSDEARKGYWTRLRKQADFRSFNLIESKMEPLRHKGTFESIIQQLQQKFCENVSLEEDVALNSALKENVFVTVVSMLNKLPCMIVGKPGSSKTLALQVISANLQGPQSRNPFWRRFPAVTMFQFQCSPLTTASGILQQFEVAKRYQASSEDVAAVLVLDEIGLAEFSPDMPLKVLHGLLVDPPIPIVGVSNWALDAAKMNRAICLSRPSPNFETLVTTGRHILGESKAAVQQLLNRMLEPLASAFHTLIQEGEKKRASKVFFGMRDYYSLLKMMKRQFTTDPKRLLRGMTSHDLNMLVCRNFGGDTALLTRAVRLFHIRCLGHGASERPVHVLDLARANLCDAHARHLLLFTSNSMALEMLFGAGLIQGTNTRVLIGSQFTEDASELQLIHQINDVRRAMEAGDTLILVNHFNIFESLYDLLNMRYVTKTNKQGKRVRMLRLAIGSRSQLCEVADGFKVIVIVEDAAKRKLDLPFLNRFERQLMRPHDVVTKYQQPLVEELLEWVRAIVRETGLGKVSRVFPCLTNDSLPSAVLLALKFKPVPSDEDMECAGDLVKDWLYRIATPSAVLHSPTLQEAFGGLDGFLQTHGDLAAVMRAYVLRPKKTHTLSSLQTAAPAEKEAQPQKKKQQQQHADANAAQSQGETAAATQGEETPSDGTDATSDVATADVGGDGATMTTAARQPDVAKADEGAQQQGTGAETTQVGAKQEEAAEDVAEEETVSKGTATAPEEQSAVGDTASTTGTATSTPATATTTTVTEEAKVEDERTCRDNEAQHRRKRRTYRDVDSDLTVLLTQSAAAHMTPSTFDGLVGPAWDVHYENFAAFSSERQLEARLTGFFTDAAALVRAATAQDDNEDNGSNKGDESAGEGTEARSHQRAHREGAGAVVREQGLTALASDTKTHALLVLQCDSLAAKAEVIRHAMWLCRAGRDRMLRDSGLSPRQASHIKVLVVLHLPPSVKGRKRYFPLTFMRDWQCLFCDDLRPQQQGAFRVQVQRTVYELVRDGHISVERALKTQFMAALSRCRVPVETAGGTAADHSGGVGGGRGRGAAEDGDGDGDGSGGVGRELSTPASTNHYARVVMFSRLLKNARFLALFAKVVEEVARVALADGKHSTVHVQWASKTPHGSLRESLHTCLEAVIVDIMAYVLPALDHHFTLSVLDAALERGDRASVDLCFKLWGSPTVLDVEALGMTYRPQQHRVITMPHAGQHAIAPNAFPMSYRIMKHLVAEQTRALVLTKAGTDVMRAASVLQQACHTVFGPSLVRAWASQRDAQRQQLRYLYDLVNYHVAPSRGLTWQQHARCLALIGRACDPVLLASVAGLHAVLMQNELRLSTYLSLLANEHLSGVIHVDSVLEHLEDCVDSLLSSPSPQQSGSTAYGAAGDGATFLAPEDDDDLLLDDADDDADDDDDDDVEGGEYDTNNRGDDGHAVGASPATTAGTTAMAATAGTSMSAARARLQTVDTELTKQVLRAVREKLESAVGEDSLVQLVEAVQTIHTVSPQVNRLLCAHGSEASDEHKEDSSSEEEEDDGGGDDPQRNATCAQLREMAGLSALADLLQVLQQTACQPLRRVTSLRYRARGHLGPLELEEAGVTPHVLGAHVLLENAASLRVVDTAHITSALRTVAQVCAVFREGALFAAEDAWLSGMTAVDEAESVHLLAARRMDYLQASLVSAYLQHCMACVELSPRHLMRARASVCERLWTLLSEFELEGANHGNRTSAAEAKSLVLRGALIAFETVSGTTAMDMCEQRRGRVSAQALLVTLWDVMDRNAQGHADGGSGSDKSARVLTARAVKAVALPKAALSVEKRDDGVTVFLRGLVACHRALSSFTRSLQRRSATRPPAQSPQGPLAQLLAEHWAGLHVLKRVRRTMGIEGIAMLTAWTEQQRPWVKLDRTLQVAASDRLPDVFKHFTHAQNQPLMNVAVHFAVTCDDYSELKHQFSPSLLSSELMNAFSCFLGAYFSQVIEPNLHRTRGVKELHKWLRANVLSRLSGPAYQLLQWILDGCRFGFSHTAEDEEDHEQEDVVLQQLAFVLGIIAMRQPRSWLGELVVSPASSSKAYIVTIPGNELALIFNSSPYVGWYRCPNGHLYSVGECTMPMQQSRCPDCKKSIGGLNHNMLSTNTRISDSEYSNVGRPLTTTFVAALRLILHLSVRLSLFAFGPTSAMQFLRGPKRSISKTQARFVQDLTHVCLRDLDAIARRRSLREAYMLVVLLLKHMHNSAIPPAFSTADKRDAYERTLQNATANKYLTDPAYLRRAAESAVEDTRGQQLARLWNWCKQQIEVADGTNAGESAAGSSAQDKSSARADLASVPGSRDPRSRRRRGGATDYDDDDDDDGDDDDDSGESMYFESLLSQRMDDESGASLLTMLRSPREPVTLDRFFEDFQSSSEYKTRHRLLDAVQRMEERLVHVHVLVDILAWHAVLFDVFPDGSLTREQAAEITNADVVAMLPVGRREAASRVLDRFCTGFNAAFPLLHPNIYECDPNPFLTQRKEVDLSGLQQSPGLPMSPSVAIIFSLPAHARGETDARGLCTLQLCRLLANAHNELVTALAAARAPVNTAAAMTVDHAQQQQQGQQRQQQQPQQQHVVRADAQAVASAFGAAVSHLTPRVALDQAIIKYSRGEMERLVRLHAIEPLRYAVTGITSWFDFAGVENALARRLLHGKSTIQLELQQYHYGGELNNTGHLSTLRMRVPQAALSKAVSAHIVSELDTQNRINAVLGHLEACISFLASVGGLSAAAGISEETLLADYITGTLLVNADTWASASCDSINRHVQLRHVQSLFVLLEQQLSATTLDFVHSSYREPLPADVVAVLKRDMHAFDFDFLQTLLRDLLVNRLTEANFPSDGPLKDYLEYLTEVDISEAAWFQFLPDTLALAHAHSLYEFVSSSSSSSSQEV
ncbi:hypothetical protein PTSG_02206 [Salpingoeca rosetta]|uniref:RZ-type domain-containing protein n=1 Tax=Salpingoeca rosetta (strain ATCC 50818 / BSB-021) TaxID=946362 RepID=F2U1I7_SALR5|nr:uncharacterized protein PTSG_02206 [Salpingoeca rosetta]EGD81489.1 hypothetical protein PTSG_02206 [Salpingoeca rosetta]|eukprot:XP_004996693.1 hypothetical protein PTSG_02206 [Salpingoeca rosetta]